MIKGIKGKLQVYVVKDAVSFSISDPVSLARQNFHPQLALSYKSWAGNSPFGVGWDINIPTITRKTEKQLPLYRGDEESGTFILASDPLEKRSKWIARRMD